MKSELAPFSRVRLHAFLQDVLVNELFSKSDEELLDQLYALTGVKVDAQGNTLVIEVPYPVKQLTLDLVQEDRLSLSEVIDQLNEMSRDISPIYTELVDQAMRFLRELKKARGA